MMNQQQILECVQSGDPQQMQLLLTLLASQAPAAPAAAPAPAPKPKPTISRNSRKNLPPSAAGANIYEIYEADGTVSMLCDCYTTKIAGTNEYQEHEFEGDQAYLNGYKVNAPTLKEAREQFYGGLKHYLPRTFKQTIDERGAKTEAQFTPVAKPAPITEVKTLHGSPDIMSRDQLKAALGYDRSSKVATKTMRAEFAALQGNATPPAVPTPAPKPAVHIPQPQTQDISQLIADLMARKNG